MKTHTAWWYLLPALYLDISVMHAVAGNARDAAGNLLAAALAAWVVHYMPLKPRRAATG